MSIFPTQYSTLCARALNTHLAQAYGLSNTNCRLLIKNVSDTYVLEGGETQYIFKIYRDAHRNVDEINGEVELLNALKAGGASVSYPIRDLGGHYLQSFNAAEGTRYGVLFSWADGEVKPMMTNAQLKTLGREMALLHNISANVKLQHPRKAYDIASTITRPLETIVPAFKNLPEEYTYLASTAAQVTGQLKQANLEGFDEVYLQFDFLPKNFHFNGDEQITFFDFDFAGRGALMFDIASFYMHYFFDITYGKMGWDDARKNFSVFLDSYQKHRPLRLNELAMMRELGFAWWIFYLGFQYENFDDWSNSFFTPRYLKDRVGVIKKWMEHELFVTI